MIFDLRPFSYN